MKTDSDPSGRGGGPGNNKGDLRRFLLSLGRLDSTNMTWNLSPEGLSERLVALATRFAFGFLSVWWLWLLATLDFCGLAASAPLSSPYHSPLCRLLLNHCARGCFDIYYAELAAIAPLLFIIHTKGWAHPPKRSDSVRPYFCMSFALDWMVGPGHCTFVGVYVSFSILGF